jgi:hypothetical protein
MCSEPVFNHASWWRRWLWRRRGVLCGGCGKALWRENTLHVCTSAPLVIGQTMDDGSGHTWRCVGISESVHAIVELERG